MSISNLKEKLIISQNDKDILDNINRDRNLLEDGLVWEAWIVSIRIWLPNDDIEGVIDICFPRGEDNSYGFSDVLEGYLKKDSIGVYKLYSRERGLDIPKHFIPIIEKNILIPISMGAIIPYHHHVYNKGIVCKVADIKAKQFRFVLENIEIISPYENNRLIGSDTNESIPKSYKKRIKEGIIDIRKLIREGENEKIEFKSSARWDYKQGGVNKQLQKSILKTITGFLNSNGGRLLIGIDDEGNIIGLENDIKTIKKKNLDGYKLFLGKIISDKIGKQINTYINISFPNIQGKLVCSLEVKKSEVAAFLKDNNQNKFFVRTHNQTQELDSKETVEYVSLRFKK